MRVKELIEHLAKMPPDADVYHLWDGALRTEINVVYLAKNGSVVTADYDMVCYHTEERPVDAPTRSVVMYWQTPSNPNPNDDED